MAIAALLHGGYALAPYLHNHISVELKEKWENSSYVDNVYFATVTFSEECKGFFPNRSNHYLIARFKDSKKILQDLDYYKQDKIAFVFSFEDEFFRRNDNKNELNFLSIYYLDYTSAFDDLKDIAATLSRNSQVSGAGMADLSLPAKEVPKFTFPYSKNLILIEMSGDKTPQSNNKYCEKTRKDVNRKGVVMTNFVSVSVLERIK